jgi:hypothetical protein
LSGENVEEREERQRRLPRSDDVGKRFELAARGIEVGEKDWFFSGRKWLLGELVDWLNKRNVPRRTEDLTTVDSPITRRELEPTTDFLRLLKECVGAVSLSGLMFKPFTNTKTCVLFLKKRSEEFRISVPQPYGKDANSHAPG